MVLGATFALPLAACGNNRSGGMSSLFGSSEPKLMSRGDRMIRWVYNAGEERMMAPEPMAVMGITNEGRDIPVRLLGEYGPDGRYVIALTDIRKVWEFILHRFQNDVFIFHNMDKNFSRLSSVRFAKGSRPTFITDTAFADADFQKQLAFWVDRMPGR
jgi:hypothetical protein